MAKSSRSTSATRKSRPLSSPDLVVGWVEDGLHSGRLVPGQKLMEAQLIDTLGVSRGPVREGLKRLHGKGIVELAPHRGAQIRALTREEADDLLVVLEPLTALMAELAADAVAAGTPAKSLENIHAWMETFSRGDLADTAFAGQRERFYNTLMTLGGNRELPQIMPLVLLQLLRRQSYPYLAREQRQDIINEYLDIIHAVLAGDGERASKAGRNHVRAARRRLASLPPSAFQPARE